MYNWGVLKYIIIVGGHCCKGTLLINSNATLKRRILHYQKGRFELLKKSIQQLSLPRA